MRIIANIRKKLEGIILATNRYPLTILFLVAIAVVNALSITRDLADYSTYLFSFIIGAMLSIVSEQLYERFFVKQSERMLLMGGTLILTGLYYFTIGSASVLSMENGVKTAVIIFALLMAFIWIPAIKTKLTFNESFLAAFKGFFTTILFAAVISGGIGLIIFAVDNLLFSVDDKTIVHAMNLIWSLFAPIFFLSFIPMYLGKQDVGKPREQLAQREAEIEIAIGCPKNLDILISYVIIPLTAVYTIILLIYVILNIRGDFWTENLMEPLLVSYAVTVIIVYILASNVENKFSILFRKIFPKVLIPIVLFQTIASILKIGDMGVTHGRYYVIMFGVFALISGIIFSFSPPKKNGLIVAVLLVFSAISVIPPIDAFSISRTNQTNLLKNVLIENNMLENNKVVPNANVSTENKRKITQTVQYLSDMEYVADIDWLPENPLYYDSFRKTFGFDETYDYSDRHGGDLNKYAYFEIGDHGAIPITGYDFMASRSINSQVTEGDTKTIVYDKNGESYTLRQQRDQGETIIQLVNADGEELIHFNTMDIFDALFADDGTDPGAEGMLSAEQATFTAENDEAKLTIIIQSLHMYRSNHDAQMYLFVQIK